MSKFSEQVYNLCIKIPRGKVTTYKSIADALESSPRAVGQALKKNKNPDAVPCFKVVKSNGELGGYYGNNHLKLIEKIHRLNGEGIKVDNGRIVKFEEVTLKP